jgi:NitT/TauT family transport system substrate-binding protein
MTWPAITRCASRRQVGRWALAGLLFAVGGACQAAPAAPTGQVSRATAGVAAMPPTAAGAPATPRPIEPISMRFDFLARGYHVIFLAAKERGYYAEQGLDLSLAEGQGSGPTLQVLINGSETFGMVDAGVAARGVEAGADVRVFLAVFQQNVFGILSPRDRPLTQPADLEGKQLAFTPGAVAEIMWPVFARKTRLDESRVTLLNVDATAKATLMRNGQADGAFHLVPTDSTIYEAGGFPVASLRYSDFGLSRLGTGIAARGQTLREKPDLVRRFVAATQRGWQTAIDDPDLAPRLVREAFTVPRSDESLRLEWTRMMEYMTTPRTRDKPLGWMDAADWQETQQVLLDAEFLKERLPVDRYYTNEFIQ